MRSNLVVAFVHWTWMRAVLHRGWWLVTSVYLVVDAELSAAQLVLIGSVQGVCALVCEVPAGVLADTISRKWSLVVSQLLMGTAMLVTGLVTAFPLLLATQALWGLAWTFASGADVAWITDELTGSRVSPVLARAARAELTGSASGLLAIGVLAWATRRDLAMVLAGSAMLLLTFYVIARFSEEHFVPRRTARWSASWTIFKHGLALVRRSPAIRRIFLATFLINGAADAAGRLAPKQLLDLGLPLDPVRWLTAIGVIAVLIGALALRLIANRVDGPHAHYSYAGAAAIGAIGLLGLGFAPNSVAASTFLLLFSGIAVPLTRIIGVIWVNTRTTTEVRATTHSFLAQSEYLGEITTAPAIALAATLATLPLALTTTAALFALTAVLMLRAGGLKA